MAWGARCAISGCAAAGTFANDRGTVGGGGEMFVKLAAAIDKLLKQEWRENPWTRPGTWAAIDEHVSKDKAGTLTRQEGRKLGRMEMA